MLKKNFRLTNYNTISVSDHSSLQFSFQNYEDGDVVFVLEHLVESRELQNIFQNNNKSIYKIINGQTDYGMTLLHYAVLIDNQSIVEELLNHGANVNAEDQTKSRPIHYAQSSNVVRLLVDCNADINAMDSQGCSIFTKAFICDNIDLIEFLLKNGVDPGYTKQYCGITLDYNDTKLLDIMLCGVDGYNSDE